MQILKGFPLAFALAMITACGGGGGKSQGPTQPASSLALSVSPNPVVMFANTSDNDSGLQFSMTIDNWQDGTFLYFNLHYQTTCIADISFLPGVTGNRVTATIIFKHPWALGVGTYSDTVEVQVATDSQGVNQIVNSPLVIPVTYDVYGPAMLDISPNYVHAGDPDTTFTFTGYGFLPQTSIWYDSGFATADYLSPTVVTATIPAAVMATAGVLDLAVLPGTGFSNQFLVPVLASGDRLPSITPSTAMAGGSDLILAITGPGTGWECFLDGTTQVYWNAEWLATTVVSPTELKAVLPAAMIQKAGQAVVYVSAGNGYIVECFDFTVKAAGTAPLGAEACQVETVSTISSKSVRKLISRQD